MLALVLVLFNVAVVQSPRLKNSGKYNSSQDLIYGLSVRIEAASYFQQINSVQFNRFNIGAFLVLMRTRLNIEPFSTRVGFIFLKSSQRSCNCQSRDTSCRHSWVEDRVLKLGLRNYDSSRNF